MRATDRAGPSRHSHDGARLRASPIEKDPIMAPKVLVSDALSETAVQIFRDRGVEVDYLPDLGKDKEKLLCRHRPV